MQNQPRVNLLFMFYPPHAYFTLRPPDPQAKGEQVVKTCRSPSAEGSMALDRNEEETELPLKMLAFILVIVQSNDRE